MKVLQINGYESPGRRFHGLSIAPILRRIGVESQHLVWEKDTDNPEVLTFEDTASRELNAKLAELEQARSLQSVLYRNGPELIRMPAFEEADVVHLHIIHSGYLSLGDLSLITERKPTVWTLHDPWAMTGHCVYPFECQRWKTGCGSCPDLAIHFPLQRDTTRFLHAYKKSAYRQANFELIVASQWMRDMVSASPMFPDTMVHQVPFGVDLDFFHPDASAAARQRFGIEDDTLVICFRAVANKFKGMPHIVEALEHLQTTSKVCLLTLNSKGLLEQFSDRFQVVELGWTNDEQLARDAIAACDMFLMPSMVEAFGVMAIEAFACAKPVVVFEGTSLPEVTFAPDVGVAVPMGDGAALGDAIQQLADNPELRRERGRLGRQMAEQHYCQEQFAGRLADIYKSLAGL